MYVYLNNKMRVPMVDSTSSVLNDAEGTSFFQQDFPADEIMHSADSKVIEMQPKSRMRPSRDAVFFVQLFARAYRHSS